MIIRCRSCDTTVEVDGADEVQVIPNGAGAGIIIAVAGDPIGRTLHACGATGERRATTGVRRAQRRQMARNAPKPKPIPRDSAVSAHGAVELATRPFRYPEPSDYGLG